MSERTLDRREMNRLALAAFGGLLAGSLAGCGAGATGKGAGDKGATGADETASLLLHDPHVCRGINTCKNKGKSGTTNECAGRAHCATLPSHDCNGLNDCKGQGGCGEHPGENACKGKGGCAVPLSDKTWPKARKRFEELMTKAAKSFGDAPAKA